MSAESLKFQPSLAVWRDPNNWRSTSDGIVVLLAVSLPWSTSLVGIFGALFVLTVMPTIEWRTFLNLLKRPVCALPIALFALASAGTLWSDAPWSTRFHSVGPAAKLLVLPVLIYHFERSTRGIWVVVGFFLSCTLLMLASWLVFYFPYLSMKGPEDAARGIFVKNYIAQSQEFALCAVALAYPIVALLRTRRVAEAALLSIIALSFFVNMAFLVVSRTALVTIPIMFIAFGVLHLRWRSVLILLCIFATLSVVAWQASPALRRTVDAFSSDYRLYNERNMATSIGLRLEFWRKSLGFFMDAPLIGHGTGATRGLFEQAAVGGPEQASSAVVGNPHNQTLHVAVQWGIVGVVVLYAMWVLHLLLFRDDGFYAWIGLLVVVQNIFTSLFNSHIFDFHEGWMYVLGVGVLGGSVLRDRAD